MKIDVIFQNRRYFKSFIKWTIHPPQLQQPPHRFGKENYFYYFPDKTQEEYLAYAKDFLSLCRYADISLYAEVLKLADWEACDYKFPY